MKIKKNKQQKRKEGFTLIELLVVISIIALVSTIGITAFNSARRKARDARRYSDMNAIQKALDMYYLDYGQYPGGIGTYLSTEEDFMEYLENYLPALPVDPVNSDNEYYLYYRFNSQGANAACTGYSDGGYILVVKNLESYDGNLPNPKNQMPDCGSGMAVVFANNYDYVIVNFE